MVERQGGAGVPHQVLPGRGTQRDRGKVVGGGVRVQSSRESVSGFGLLWKTFVEKLL